MKNKLLFLMFFAATPALAADGTINFTGEILESACQVDTSSANQTVELGKVSASAFDQSGATAAATKFDIKLTNCPTTDGSPTIASVKFDGTNNTTNPDILALTGTSTAKDVGIAIYEKDGATLIPMSNKSQDNTIDTTSSAVTLSFIAKYMSTAAKVGAGTANGTTNFTIIYK